MHTARNIALLTVAAVVLLTGLLAWNSRSKRPGEVEGEIVFFCAAGVKPPVERVAKQYEEEYGISIQLQYGGSGTLLSNLRTVRMGDLYLAADESYIEIGREQGLIAESIPLAVLTPVIAVRKGNPKNVHVLKDLLREDVAVALANPTAAAVGRASKSLFEKTGDWERMEKSTKVFKPTVNDIANDIKIGTVDAGIVWDAVVKQYEELEAVTIPDSASETQRIAVGVLKTSKNSTAALRFARYLGGRNKGLAEFEKDGYQPVQGDIWEENPELVLFSGGVNRLAIEDTLKKFEEREGVKITRVYNGCGILVSQMKAGEMPDAYFACDASFMTQVADMFLDSTTVAETDMVIVVQKGNPKGIKTLADLTAEGLAVGVANPKQSALGALTQRMLEASNLYEKVEKNVKVKTPTADLLVNQIRTGSLDAVIVYRANTPYVRDDLDILSIDNPAAKAVQPYAVSKDSPHRYLMERLLDSIQSEESKQIFEEIGFRLQGAEVRSF